MSADLPSVAEAKAQAKALRASHAAQGKVIGHGQALDLLAKTHGYRDWNGMSADIGDRVPCGLNAGARVTGHYMSHPFTATVTNTAEVRPGWVQLCLHLDEAVDVVTSDAFSNFRQRIRSVIGPQGYSADCTSDGEPHLRVDL
jgi:hypothetical protein